MHTYIKQNWVRSGLLLAALAVGGAVTLTASCKSSNNQPDPAAFVFATDAPAAYAQIDSHAMPEVGTALIEAANGLSGTALRDSYNSQSPTARGNSFNAEIGNSLALFHTALDDDLTGLGLDPATPAEALAQGAPLVVPEVLRYNPAQPASFPNGRGLTDRVVDVTLAVVLLDLAAPGQTATIFADIPLNPAGNDKAFSASFPYLAAPHN
jgi:hypothetical protein